MSLQRRLAVISGGCFLFIYLFVCFSREVAPQGGGTQAGPGLGALGLSAGRCWLGTRGQPCLRIRPECRRHPRESHQESKKTVLSTGGAALTELPPGRSAHGPSEVAGGFGTSFR